MSVAVSAIVKADVGSADKHLTLRRWDALHRREGMVSASSLCNSKARQAHPLPQHCPATAAPSTPFAPRCGSPSSSYPTPQTAILPTTRHPPACTSSNQAPACAAACTSTSQASPASPPA